MECRDLLADLQDCKDAIVQAYKQINMKCLGYSVRVQGCVSDCLGESSEDSQDAKTVGCGCGDQAEMLKDCERGVLAKVVRSYDIDDIVHVDD